MFQSTRPTWGATVPDSLPERQELFQSTRPTWGATQWRRYPARDAAFQSTRPTWGATPIYHSTEQRSEVSIHAPHVGRDRLPATYAARFGRFNPRAPRGARRTSARLTRRFRSFNPRASRGARQRTVRRSVARLTFQSTRPTWGATIDQAAGHPEARSFNPRAPRGARLQSTHAAPWNISFQSTRPTWGATLFVVPAVAGYYVSIHAPHVGRDRTGRKRRSGWRTFQSTRPTWGATWGWQ